MSSQFHPCEIIAKHVMDLGVCGARGPVVRNRAEFREGKKSEDKLGSISIFAALFLSLQLYDGCCFTGPNLMQIYLVASSKLEAYRQDDSEKCSSKKKKKSKRKKEKYNSRLAKLT